MDNFILDKENHSVFIPDAARSSMVSSQPSQIRPQRKASSLILGTGRAGGRPPDDRNLVVLKGRKVVQKPHMRSKLTRGTLGMSSNIFEGRFVDSFEQPDLIEDEENAQKATGEEKGTSSIVN